MIARKIEKKASEALPEKKKEYPTSGKKTTGPMGIKEASEIRLRK